MVRGLAIGAAVCLAAEMFVPAQAGAAPPDTQQMTATDMSGQTRRETRRARTRIEVRPLRGPLRRDCVPVFQERWIPQWGGSVLYAGQECHWTRAPY